MAPAYKYKPLQGNRSIRLLEILPSEGPIQCSIIEAGVNGTPYFALSYTWGHPYNESPPIVTDGSKEPIFEIYCEGASIEVTENAYRALQRLQRLYGTGPMQACKYGWIDAICINQADLVERNSQVAMMGDIYANCYFVLMWLGEADPDSTKAISNIWAFGTALETLFEAEEDYPGGWAAIEFNDPKFYEHIGMKPLGTREWQCIIHLFTRRWFSRGWITQEFVLPKNVVLLYDEGFLNASPLIYFTGFCSMSGWVNGLSSVPLVSLSAETPNGLRQLCSTFTYRLAQTSGPEYPPNIQLLADKFHAHTPDQRLYAFFQNLIMHTRSREVGDPRDKVFVPLALATYYVPKLRPDFEWLWPNYGEPLQDAFTRVTGFLIRKSPMLSMLSQVEDKSKRVIQGLPSWVPDFTVMSPGPLTPPHFHATSHWSTAEGHSARLIPPNILQVMGTIPDSVVAVAPPKEDIVAHHLINDWMKLILDLPPQDHTQQSTIEQLLRTLIANSDMEIGESGSMQSPETSFRSFILFEMAHAFMDAQKKNTIPEAFWRTQEAFTTLAPIFKDLLPSKEEVGEEAIHLTSRASPEVSSEKLPSMTEYRERFWIMSSQRRLVRTRRGCLALAPASCQVGDEVAFLLGAKAPFILRGTAEDKWELLGEAYVHGFMQGEIAMWGDPLFQDIMLV